MKADNSQIARAVFFKLYHADRDKEACSRAALRLAAAILNRQTETDAGNRNSLTKEIYGSPLFFNI